MTEFTDEHGNILVISRPNGPGKEFGAVMHINGGQIFHPTEQHCRDIRSVLEDLLDWDNSRRVKPS